MAQSDARTTDNQEVAISISAGSGNILSWRLMIKYFLRSFSPFRKLRRTVFSFLCTRTG